MPPRRTDTDWLASLPSDILQCIFRLMPQEDALRCVLSKSLTPSKHGDGAAFLTSLSIHKKLNPVCSQVGDIIERYPNTCSLTMRLTMPTLSYNTSVYSGLKTIYEKIMRLQYLKDLELDIPSAPSVSTTILRALETNKTLTALTLSNSLPLYDVVDLGKALKYNRSLKVLALGAPKRTVERFFKPGDEGATILCDALRENKMANVQELSLQNNNIGPVGAIAIAKLCSVSASMTRLDVRYAPCLGEEDRAALHKAIGDRSEFELLM